MSDTIEVFISYSKQDKELRDGLLSHLRPLEREGIITWHDRQILPGTEWDKEIKARLNAADIILLLLSADFLATDYCIQVEIPEALRRHKAGEATVMPVILRSCAWNFTPLAAIQAYPEKAKPIKSWTDIDEAYTDVVKAVHLAATEIQKRRSQQQEEQERIQQEQQRQAGEQERLWQAEQLRQQQTANQPKSSPDDLRGDYAQMERWLKAGEWEKADQETAKQMCQVMGRQKERFLRVEDIENFPCADLRTIDHLWLKYSQGYFGFSVQKQFYVQFGGKLAVDYQNQRTFSEVDGETWRNFGIKVGWRKKDDMGHYRWISYEHVTFALYAPTGHLPCKIWERHPRCKRKVHYAGEDFFVAMGGVGGYYSSYYEADSPSKENTVHWYFSCLASRLVDCK